VPGTGQLWGSGCFLLMELGTILGTRARGDALTGIRPEERPSPLRKHAGLDCTRLDLHLRSLPWDQGNTLCSFPSPRGQLQAGPFVLLLHSVFLGSAAPQIAGELPLMGAVALRGSVVSLRGSREKFPPPQPGLLGTGHFKGGWLFSSM